MDYIVFDLELNQEPSSVKSRPAPGLPLPFEIIQIGALKLDSGFNTVAAFNRYVKPDLYEKINPFVAELTGITAEQLLSEQLFPEIYREFCEFAGGETSVFCVWGSSDMKQLYRSAEYHRLSSRHLSKKYINLQPYASMYLHYPVKTQLRLEYAVRSLGIPVGHSFHNAFYDAYYTGEILKKIHNNFMKAEIYDPDAVRTRPARSPKKTIDTQGIIEQFEKMYGRNMTSQEKDIILLAYKMGKTGQFLK